MRLTDLPLDEVTRRFEDLALRHTAKHGFRAYDILHVSSALTLKCHTFWSFDKRASKLAKLEGLTVI
jgi:predicted nucleic acid-binding protein